MLNKTVKKFNAKTQRRGEAAKIKMSAKKLTEATSNNFFALIFIFAASPRLCVFALNFFTNFEETCPCLT